MSVPEETSLPVLLLGLPAGTSSLLRQLNLEFYGGELAPAEVFRVLPLMADAIERDSEEQWPLKDVLRKLMESSEILLERHDYDGQGHEEISLCVKRAKQLLGTL